MESNSNLSSNSNSNSWNPYKGNMQEHIDEHAKSGNLTGAKNFPRFGSLVPLLYAPVIPLVRIAFKDKPAIRNRMFVGVIAVAFMHGVYMVSEGDM